MKFRNWCYATLGLLGFAAIGTSEAARLPKMTVVPKLVATRYMGRWYEIALIPHWFERGCSDTTATYTLTPEDRIDVLNQCLRSGKPHQAHAIAWHNSPGGDGEFYIRFFWPFDAPYWVIALDPDYQWAMIGHPTRRYLWILSRKRTLDIRIYEQLIHQAVALGYNPAKIQQTSHSNRRSGVQ